LTHIGEKLRLARAEQNLNLRELAGASGVSASMLCTIEHGKTMPSVQSLVAIACALRLPPSYFFEGEDFPQTNGTNGTDASAPSANSPVTLVNGRKKINLAGGIILSRLTPGPETGIEFTELLYDAGASSGEEFYTHKGREWGHVIEGELRVDVAFESYHLKAGDSIVFDSQTPHRLRNDGTKPVRAIWVNYQ
jgi:transcriptional regulator with XRE-family HTH domain